MSNRMLLFVGPDCPNCHAVISGMVQSGIIGKNIAASIPMRPQIIEMEHRITPFPLEIFDSGTVDGLAAGAFNDVRSLPTLIYMRDGEVIRRIDGDHDAILETIGKWARDEKIS